MEDLWRDIQFGFRTLLKAPGFTAVAVLTLALGIGANTALFSVIHAVLLRPLPYPDPARLVFLTEWSEQVPEMSFSMANLKDVRDQSTVFEALVGYNGQNFVLTGGGEPERLNGRQTTSGLLATLGVRPLLGRGFSPEEDKPGTEGVAMLSEGFWERRFGRDPSILGQPLTLSGEPFTVIGVLPGNLHGSWKRIDVITPLLRLEDKQGGEGNRGNHPGIYVVGRLKPGLSVDMARTEVKAIAERLAQQYPNSNARQSMTLESLMDAYVGEMRPALMLLLGAVAFVLLIACANVANLLLARAGTRQKEIAVRLALGARRGRIFRQLLTESVLLSLMGGLVGLLFAYAGVKGLLASLPPNVPRAEDIGLDLVVLAYTAAIAVGTGLLFGLVPAWRALKGDLHDPLKEGGRGTLGASHHRLRGGLVVAEVALALVLLVGAGLLLRSFFKVIQKDGGFRAEGVLTASVPLPRDRYEAEEKRVAVVDRVLEHARGQAGIASVAAALPLLGGWQSSFSVEGRPEPPPGQRPSADITRVSPDYFAAMGVRVLGGRVFEDRDRKDAPAVCMVDETFARAHWPGENAVGRRLKFGGHSSENPWMEVVGIVGHVKNYGVDEDSRVELYLPWAQSPVGAFTLIARTRGNPASLAGALRAAVRAVDPELPLYQVATLEATVAEGTAQRRLAVVLISVFAALALTLSAVGIYGVMSYTVTQRTPEIGVRMALGAARADILRMVFGSGTVLALLGIAIGLGAAFGLARVMTSLLFETSASDPPTFSIVPLLLLSVALLACWLPARRATQVDPLAALRYE